MTPERHYSAMLHWSAEDGGYVATCPEFSGLSGIGETAEEAIAVLREAVEMAIEVYTEEGRPLPEPRVRESYSGQFRLRVPRSLHAELAARAEAEGVSLNTLALSYIAHGLGAAHPREGAEERSARRRAG